MKNKLKKIIDIISIIAFIYALIMIAVVGFSILGLFLLVGLKLYIFSEKFWMTIGFIFIVCILTILIALLFINGYELIQNWSNKRK